MAERLQKLIARAGLASRRTAEAWILSGRVRVNGRVVTQLGTRADPVRDRIQVDETLLRFPRAQVYLVFNKPRAAVTTAADPRGRRTIYGFLRSLRERIFSVGRLPYEAEGLLLLTNDGEFADALLRAHLPQTFWLKVKGRLGDDEESKLAGAARRAGDSEFSWKLVKPGANPWYEAVVRAPRHDWLRERLFRLGHPVEKLRRVAIGPLTLGDLPSGHSRELTQAERHRLLAEMEQGQRRRSRASALRRSA